MRELWVHQREAVEYAVRSKRCFIAIDVGGGKSAIALETVRRLNAFPAVIVCPEIVKAKWGREIREHFGDSKSVQVLSAGIPVQKGMDIYVANYEIIDQRTKAKKDESEADRERRLARGRAHPRIAHLRALGAAAFVADESPRLKSRGARRTKAAKAIAETAQVRLALTGTPVDNGPEDYVSQLDFLDRIGEFEGAWMFKKRYCVRAHHTGDIRTCQQVTCARPLNWKHRSQCPGCPGWRICECGKDVWGYWKLDGADNLMELNARLSGSCYFRRTKEQFEKNLPPFRREVIPLTIDRTEYAQAEADFSGWMEANRGREAAERAYRAEAVVRVEVLRQLAIEKKLQGAAEWIGGLLETGEPVVAFVTHRKTAEGLGEALEVWNPQILSGDTPPAQRERTIERFQAGKDKLLLVSIRAAAIGIELTAAANCVFVELDWMPTSHEQAEGRLHRPGQKRPVVAWYLLAENTIDEVMLGVLERKRRIVSEILDGKAEGFIRFDAEMEVAKEVASGHDQGLPYRNEEAKVLTEEEIRRGDVASHHRASG